MVWPNLKNALFSKYGSKGTYLSFKVITTLSMASMLRGSKLRIASVIDVSRVGRLQPRIKSKAKNFKFAGRRSLARD